MIAVKICGIRRPEDICIVNHVLPEYIGFIFAESKRKVTKEEAAILKQQLDKRIRAVGVFVNAPAEEIISLCRENIIDTVQLHGEEDEAYIKVLKSELSNPVIKAVRVAEPDDIFKAQALSADYLLFDTYSPEQYGGIGKPFDWSIIPQGIGEFFLAGGLNSNNVTKAAKTCRPYCVDISSGVETDGVKDEEKVMKFIQIVREIK